MHDGLQITGGGVAAFFKTPDGRALPDFLNSAPESPFADLEKSLAAFAAAVGRDTARTAIAHHFVAHRATDGTLNERLPSG